MPLDTALTGSGTWTAPTGWSWSEWTTDGPFVRCVERAASAEPLPLAGAEVRFTVLRPE